MFFFCSPSSHLFYPLFFFLLLHNLSGPYGGGAIYDTSASLSVDNCTFSGNTAADGGALTVVNIFFVLPFSLSLA